MGLRTFAEWLVILIPLAIIGFLVFGFVNGAGPAAATFPGLPADGGFFQTPLPSPQQDTVTSGNWRFTLASDYTYTLAGRVVGRHEYPAAMPDGIIPLDLAVVNGDLLRPGMLSYFTFTMGDHTLKYSYDVPNYTGLTEEYIDEHISNNHLIFQNATLESEVKKAPVNSCLIIRGKLVDIHGVAPGSQFLAKTSTVRNDSYPAGCEIILVQSYTPVNCAN
jgi:hypothetical protein